MADEIPTPTKVVYLLFEFVALGCALEAIPAFEHGSVRLGVMLLFLAAIFLVIGLTIALKVAWAVGAVKKVWGKLPSQRALAGALKDNAELRTRLASVQPTPEVQERNAIPLAPNTAPSIRVDYVAGLPEKLILKNDKASVGLVRRISNLVSTELYQSEYELGIYPRTLPPIDSSNPIECTLSVHSPETSFTSSLKDVLGKSTLESVDEVVIDYDDDVGNEFSRRFVLTKSGNTVAWIPDPVVLRGQTRSQTPEADSLAVLRLRLAQADAYPNEHEAAQQYAKQLTEERREKDELERQHAEFVARAKADLPTIGQLKLLAAEAERLWNQLREIDQTLRLENKGDLWLYPLEVNFPAEGEPRYWYHSSMLRFQHVYREHVSQVMMLSLTDFKTEILKHRIPTNGINRLQLIDAMREHRNALLARVDELITPFIGSQPGKKT
jgi:hypothetical protein